MCFRGCNARSQLRFILQLSNAPAAVDDGTPAAEESPVRPPVLTAALTAKEKKTTTEEWTVRGVHHCQRGAAALSSPCTTSLAS